MPDLSHHLLLKIIVAACLLAASLRRFAGTREPVTKIWPRVWRVLWGLAAFHFFYLASIAPTAIFFFLSDRGMTTEQVYLWIGLVTGLLYVAAGVCLWVGFRLSAPALRTSDTFTHLIVGLVVRLAAWTATGVAFIASLTGTHREIERYRRTVSPPVPRHAAWLSERPWDDVLALAGWSAVVSLVGAGFFPDGRSTFLVSAGACFVMSALYALLGRLYPAGYDRALVRPVFRPYLMGSLLAVAITLLGGAVAVIYVDPGY